MYFTYPDYIKDLSLTDICSNKDEMERMIEEKNLNVMELDRKIDKVCVISADCYYYQT